MLNSMDRILDRIYVGCYSSATNLDFRNPDGITHVLNCTRDPHPGLAKFQVRQINVDDGCEIPSELVMFAIKSIGEAVHSGGKILVHCHAGVSRSPGIVAAYLVYHGFSWDEAIEMIRWVRPYVMLHPNIKRSILQSLGQLITPDTTVLGGQ
jgi:protein-tyrosine phosphatase